MSDKPKVYQGVRVKATVKELLQKKRAHQAAIKSATHFPTQDGCTTAISAHHFDVYSGSSIPDTSLQPSIYADSVYNIPVENSVFDNRFANIVLPPDNINNILPPDSCAQHWSNGHFLTSSDYYTNGMTTSSSPDSVSLNLPSPVDYNSFSPPDSYSSSSSSSCYSSPSRMDSSYGYHHQQCSAMNPEYSPYCISDCFYTSMDQNYFRRDGSGSEMCFL